MAHRPLARLLSAAVLATICAVTPRGQAASQPPQSFSTTTDLVVVPVVVENRKGEPVTTLTRDDFTLTEDGRAVAIETFQAPGQPGVGAAAPADRFVVIALDNINTPAEIGWRVKDIARRFVDRMGPHDDVSVISLANGRAASGNGPVAARQAIDRFAPMMLSARTPAELMAEGMESLGSLVEQMSRSPHRRKVLAIIGASFMFNPSNPSAFADLPSSMTSQWEDAVRDAGRANISTYLIDPRGPVATASASEFGAPGGGTSGPERRSSFIYPRGYTADAFTTRTGGLSWTSTSNYAGAVDTIWRDAAFYYLIGYRTPVNDHRLHEIEVTVRDEKLRVRARRSRG